MGMTQEVTRWAIVSLSEKETEEALKVWQKYTGGGETLRDGYSTEVMEKEAVWIETSLVDVLNSHTAPLMVRAHSKRWWTPEVTAKWK